MTQGTQTVEAVQIKRNGFLRILAALFWLPVLYFGINMLIGMVLGGIAGSQMETTGNAVQSYEVGANAATNFFKKYGLIVFILEIALWIFLSVTGKLPGTSKYKIKQA